MNGDGGVFCFCLVLVVMAACVVRSLRPAQRLVVLAGAIAAAVQAFCPPCVYPDGTTARRWMPADLRYAPGGTSPWVDAGWQAACLTATAVAVVGACVLIERRHRRRGTELDRPAKP